MASIRLFGVDRKNARIQNVPNGTDKPICGRISAQPSRGPIERQTQVPNSTPLMIPPLAALIYTNLPISLAAWTNATHDKGWVPPLTPDRIECSVNSVGAASL